MKTSLGNFLPINTAGLPNDPKADDQTLFLAGDVRANEQLGLTAMHTLFVREHNFLCDLIKARSPRFNGDQIYELARAIVAGEIQHVIYTEFLPVLIGNITSYRGYDTNVNPSMMNEFSTAAFRLGHTMLSPILALVNEEAN